MKDNNILTFKNFMPYAEKYYIYAQRLEQKTNIIWDQQEILRKEKCFVISHKTNYADLYLDMNDNLENVKIIWDIKCFFKSNIFIKKYFKISFYNIDNKYGYNICRTEVLKDDQYYSLKDNEISENTNNIENIINSLNNISQIVSKVMYNILIEEKYKQIKNSSIH